jgi:hypothetical protein
MKASRRLEPLRGRRCLERVDVFGAGRVCAAADCGTILSTYNPSSSCAVHGGRFAPVGRRSQHVKQPLVERECRNPACARVFESSNRTRAYCSDRCRVQAFQQRRSPEQNAAAER